MWKLPKLCRICASGLTLYAIGGCVHDEQLADFFRTEFARVTSDVIGQMFLIFVQATS